jgi:dephospho-CoA kinase
MLRIGLTGGIGSGKTTVAHIFATLGIPVYDADSASKRLMVENQEVKDKIIAVFGKDAYQNNQLNRTFLAKKVFKNKEKLALLNSIVHPATMLEAKNWMLAQSAPYAIKEAALIFESGSQKNLDKVIGVSSPLALRIQRTMQRNGISELEVIERMNNQMDEETKINLCDYIIVNDEEQLLIPQVLALHEKLILQSRD